MKRDSDTYANSRKLVGDERFQKFYDSALKGCMSPMMWGLYADKRKLIFNSR